MFKTTKEIIETLEDAINIFNKSSSEIDRDRSKLMVVASRYALQALALNFAERRFPIDATRIIETNTTSTPILEGNDNEKIGGRGKRRSGR